MSAAAAAGWPGPDTQNTHICLNIKPNVLHQIFLKIGLLDILIRCSTVHFIYNLDCITFITNCFRMIEANILFNPLIEFVFNTMLIMSHCFIPHFVQYAWLKM